MVCGAAVDRHENDRQRHRAVFKFLDTAKDRRAEEESVGATTVEYSQDGKDEEEYDDDYYEEYEDGMSGDYEMELPRGRDACADFVWSEFCFFSFLKTSLCVFSGSQLLCRANPKTRLSPWRLKELKEREGRGREGLEGKAMGGRGIHV